MKKRTVFEFGSYKKLMASLLLGEGQRGQLSRAAETLNCQPSFLSRVMNSEIHLTVDHAFMLTRFWKFDSEERDYFQTLVEHERASMPDYKSHLALKLTELKQNHESLQRRTQKDDFPLAEKEAIYFSSWVWSAIHFLVCIPEFQSSRNLASRLGLHESMVLNYLRQLKNFGLIKESKNRWEYLGGQFHLPKHSPFVVNHHQNWRSRAVLDSQNPVNQSIHYTTVLTLSKTDFERLKDLLLEFISESENIAKPSDSEESVVLTCDLFKT